LPSGARPSLPRTGMLDVLYIAIVVVPLALAGLALLLIALRSYESGIEERTMRLRAAAGSGPLEHGLRKREDPLAPPPSVATLGDVDLRAIGRTLAAALGPEPDVPTAPARPSEISPLAASLAFPPPVESILRAPQDRPPLEALPAPAPGLDGPAGVPGKRCPDCAEEVLAAARVCKHCRYRWDDAGDGRAELSA
jgi:hypothetical protein